jgi:hypothetical protein
MMDRDLLGELTTLLPEDLASAVPKRQKRVARRFCMECASIDLHQACIKRFGYIELELRSAWWPDECDLCNFFSLNLPRDPQGHFPVSTIQGSANDSIGDAPPPIGISGFAFDQYCRYHYILGPGFVQEPTFFAQSNRDLSSRMELTTATVNFNLIKGWLQKSPVQNSQDLRSLVANDAFPFGMEAPDDISLHVIDCVSRSLVRLPTHTRTQYVTLSYVWGSSSKSHINDVIILNMPPTVEDSIIVCLKLGYKYLWVDRYCIPQDDLQERHRQIQQMGAIYRNSALTIVACAGSDPHYGLPGVSKSRTAHSSILLENVGYIQRIPMMYDIRHSTWAQRGWTYQEALLSQARLYFTDRQVYYEDEKSLECEVNTLAEVEIPNDYKRWNSGIYTLEMWSSSPMDVYHCIEQFSTRVLSFSSDTIDALQGVFATFKQKFQIHHISGMPFTTTQSEKSVEPYQRQIPSVPRESEMPTIQYSLLFTTDHKSTRCDTFPSWSWSGWTGEKYWDEPDYSWRWALNPNFVSVVAVELASEHDISWTDFQTRYDALSLQSVASIRYIHIQAYLVPILEYTQICDSHNRPERVIDLQDGIRTRKRLYTHEMNTREILEIEECALLRFSCPMSPCPGVSVSHLLVRKKSTHWERVTQVSGNYRDCDGEILDHSFWPGVLQTIRLG